MYSYGQNLRIRNSQKPRFDFWFWEYTFGVFHRLFYFFKPTVGGAVLKKINPKDFSVPFFKFTCDLSRKSDRFIHSTASPLYYYFYRFWYVLLKFDRNLFFNTTQRYKGSLKLGRS